MREAEEGVGHSTLRVFLREIREKKKKEEKNEVEALPNCDCNQLLHRSSFDVLHSSSD